MLIDSPISVLVVDDHPVVRDGVTTQLRRQGDITVVGYAATSADACVQTARTRPDVILLDLRLPDALAADTIPLLRDACATSKILLFTAFPDHAAVAPSLAAGAHGLLIKDASGTAVRDAVRRVVLTGSYRSATASRSATAALTPREYDVLRQVASGHTNVEIARLLEISPNTVKTYLHNVMHKLNARNRAQVITNARIRGLL
ncbi:response regulator transcription factor [Gordonia terrae]|uniref:Two-component response regulator n=1 Tax=Gordonia terrae NBRC 100016 TaxID=1089454 RepID=A0ABQ0HKF2_9ACTN|nr:response regulator transcription factor [Gordonia terrae]ANY22177.1 DNA-binding response regulator [Gordonia terrae]GAB46360.1 putative two-component response regulator [Gordonia terrae NBRC 100016]VTR09562.1 response regulator containing a CheY-like receiver domain and an HTH DNA-binding domain [Clostridioides difficile]VTS29139.1 Response regulator protein vraR [Gordonia terrae]